VKLRHDNPQRIKTTKEYSNHRWTRIHTDEKRLYVLDSRSPIWSRTGFAGMTKKSVLICVHLWFPTIFLFLFVRVQSRIYGGESPLTFPDKLRAVIPGTVPIYGGESPLTFSAGPFDNLGP